MKRYFGGIFIQQEKLLEAGINYPIKLEYYKTINKDKNNEEAYGIKIIKTEYKNDINIEEENIRYITSDENQANKILTLFKENEVTPIAAQDIIDDMQVEKI